MPTVILSKNAEKDFSLLPKNEQKKIFKKLKGLKRDPFLGKMLTGQLKGLWSCRAWPYRIIYEFQQSKKLIVIHKILHRQEAYK